MNKNEIFSLGTIICAIAAIVMVIGIGLSMHKNNTSEEKKISMSMYCQMEQVSMYGDDHIYCDKTTGVLYFCYRGYNNYGITPLYNADGTLKNISDYTDTIESE